MKTINLNLLFCFWIFSGAAAQAQNKNLCERMADEKLLPGAAGLLNFVGCHLELDEASQRSFDTYTRVAKKENIAIVKLPAGGELRAWVSARAQILRALQLPAEQAYIDRLPYPGDLIFTVYQNDRVIEKNEFLKYLFENYFCAAEADTEGLAGILSQYFKKTPVAYMELVEKTQSGFIVAMAAKKAMPCAEVEKRIIEESFVGTLLMHAESNVKAAFFNTNEGFRAQVRNARDRIKVLPLTLKYLKSRPWFVTL